MSRETVNALIVVSPAIILWLLTQKCEGQGDQYLYPLVQAGHTDLVIPQVLNYEHTSSS